MDYQNYSTETSQDLFPQEMVVYGSCWERFGAVFRFRDGVAGSFQSSTNVHSADAIVIGDDRFSKVWIGLHLDKPERGIDRQA